MKKLLWQTELTEENLQMFQKMPDTDIYVVDLFSSKIENNNLNIREKDSGNKISFLAFGKKWRVLSEKLIEIEIEIVVGNYPRSLY